MLVGFSGSAGSGKTTLVNAIADRLRERGYDVGVVEEVARSVFEEFSKIYGFKSLEEMRRINAYIDFQIAVLERQTQRENEELSKHDIVLCDRTIYDNLMYTLIWCKGNEQIDTYRVVFDMFAKNRKYDLIFLCEPIDNNVDDGFRAQGDIQYREVQEWLLKLLLPDYVYLPVMKLEERVALACRVIEISYDMKSSKRR